LIVVSMTKLEEVEEDDEYVEVAASANSNNNNNNTSDFGEEDLSSAGFVINDLNWRVEKMRLEEANTRRFLKAKPRFLPYEDAQKWVQAWGARWKTAKDW
jgi:hypothetical protein